MDGRGGRNDETMTQPFHSAISLPYITIHTYTYTIALLIAVLRDGYHLLYPFPPPCLLLLLLFLFLSSPLHLSLSPLTGMSSAQSTSHITPSNNRNNNTEAPISAHI